MLRKVAEGVKAMDNRHIGGNLQDITDAGGSLKEVGGKTDDTTRQTKEAAEFLLTEVDTAMANLKKSFNVTAGELTDKITAADNRLGAATWTGTARETADNVRLELNTGVGNVIKAANENLDAEKLAFQNRVGALIDHIDTEFRTVMGEVNDKYTALGAAAQQTAVNLAEADKTIQVNV